MIITSLPKLNENWDETAFTNAIRDAVSFFGGTTIKLGASQFMAKGTPDTYYTLGGVSFLMESKVHPNKMSPIQQRVISDIRKANGKVWAITFKVDHMYLDTGEKFDNFTELFIHIYSECKKLMEPNWCR